MADLSAFSNDNFHTTVWVNNALKERQDEEGLESYLASLAMKLHIISQDYSDQLETGMVEAISTMPRVMTEVARLEDTLHTIEGEMATLASQLRALDLKNVAGIEDLSRLDTLKSNMENCRATLEEHARWSQLVREAKTFLESGGRLVDSADRIEVMSRSLEILANIPGHEERQETFTQLSDTLMSILRPRVRRDIIGFDLSPLHEYLYVYEKMGRRQELEEEYIKARPQRLRSSWDTLLQDHGSGGSQLPKWLHDYYHSVLVLLEDESRNVESIFGRERCPAVLSSILAFAVGSICQTVAHQLKRIASPATAAEAYHTTDEFAKKVARFFDLNITSNSSNNGAETSGKLSPETFAAIFGGFQIYLDSYGDEEAKHLRSQLTTLVDGVYFGADRSNAAFTSNADAIDNGGEDDFFDALDPYNACNAFSERLVSAADACVVPVEACLLRAVRIMGGVKTKVVFRSAAAVYSQFVKQLAGRIDELGVACGTSSLSSRLGDISQSSNSGEAGSNSTSTNLPGTNNASTAEHLAQQLESLEGSRPLIQCALRALQAGGRLTRRTRDVEAISAAQSAALAAALQRELPFERAVVNALLAPDSDISNNNNNGSLGAALAVYALQQDFSACSELRSFLASSTSLYASQTVFSTSLAPLTRCKALAGTLLFDLCTSAPEKVLATVATDDVWSAAASAHNGSYESDGASLDPSFSEYNSADLLPQQSFTQIGDHMLSLVQELETFASSDALVDLLHLSAGDAQQLAVASRGWRQLRGLLDLRDDESVDSICRRATCGSALTVLESELFGSQVTVLGEETHSSSSASAFLVGGELPSGDEDAAALAFVNEWLGYISDAVVGLVLAQVLQIKKLSKAGAAQLLVDLEYMGNVVNAMGLRAHPLLLHLQLLVKGDNLVTLRTTLAEAASARSATASVLNKFDRKILAIME